MKPEPLYYIQREGGEAGPYDLVQMARLLRRKIIAAETPTRLEGAMDWTSFGDRSSYIVACEMSPDANSDRTLELDAEARNGPVPLPSAQMVVTLCAVILGLLAAGAVAYFIARADATVGTAIIVAAATTALVSQCLILLRMMDEGWATLLFMVFVPFGELYYFLTNIGIYYRLFLAKYAGIVIAIAASAGLAARH